MNILPANSRYLSLFLLIFMVGFPIFDSHAQQMRMLENTAFQRGEKLSYRAFYDSYITGNVVAGYASLELMKNNEVIGGRNTVNAVGIAKTRTAFSLFFRVVNRYESFFDEEAIVPLVFIRRIHEGNYRRNQHVIFNQTENVAISNTATVPTTPNVQDLISAFYYLRTNDYNNAKIGDIFSVDFFLDDSVYVSRVIFDGREDISTRMGTFKTLRFKPMVLTENVFSQPYPMTLWISDDQNKIPVLIQTGLIVGSLKMELIEYKGLKNPMLSKIK